LGHYCLCPRMFSASGKDREGNCHWFWVKHNNAGVDTFTSSSQCWAHCHYTKRARQPYTLPEPIMSEATYKCEHCGRDNFKIKRGLSKHKLENKGCRDHLKARFGSTADTKIAAACLPVDTAHNWSPKTALLEAKMPCIVQMCPAD